MTQISPRYDRTERNLFQSFNPGVHQGDSNFIYLIQYSSKFGLAPAEDACLTGCENLASSYRMHDVMFRRLEYRHSERDRSLLDQIASGPRCLTFETVSFDEVAHAPAIAPATLLDIRDG